MVIRVTTNSLIGSGNEELRSIGGRLVLITKHVYLRSWVTTGDHLNRAGHHKWLDNHPFKYYYLCSQVVDVAHLIFYRTVVNY
jgi:hypothetical protein